jgi:TonB family protein
MSSGDIGTGPSGIGEASVEVPAGRDKHVVPDKIFFKPKPSYTDEARANNVQGTVRLKVTLLRSGNIGAITPVRKLPDGLTEMAVAAARQIQFEPRKINGVPMPVTLTIDYNFTIY